MLLCITLLLFPLPGACLDIDDNDNPDIKTSCDPSHPENSLHVAEEHESQQPGTYTNTGTDKVLEYINRSIMLEG